MGEMRSQITEKEKQILTKYFLCAGNGQLPRSQILSLPKGLRSPANNTAAADDTSVFFTTILQLYSYVKVKHGGLYFSFFFPLNFSLEGQKCCHIAYSNQFKQYQIFPKEQKRINQHVKNSLLLPLAQLSQASPNLQLSPVGEDVNEISLKTAVLRIPT